MRTRDSLPKPNIVKKSLKGVYPFWANLYQKNADPGLPPEAKYCKKSLEGVYPFWANLYQKLPISAILGAHILKVTMVKFGTRMRSWESLPKSNFI